MENKNCILCMNLHDGHLFDNGTQKGNICDTCHVIDQEQECNVCHHVLPIEDFVTSIFYDEIDLPEEMCSECAQEYAYEFNAKYRGY